MTRKRDNHRPQINPQHCDTKTQITESNTIWAVAWDFQQCGKCNQQRLRPACPYSQTNESLCWSLKYSMAVKLLTEPHLRFLSLKGGCTGSSESTLVKMPHCWKSCVMAHLSYSARPRGYNTWVHSQTQNKAQWLAACLRKQPIIVLYFVTINKKSTTTEAPPSNRQQPYLMGA